MENFLNENNVVVDMAKVSYEGVPVKLKSYHPKPDDVVIMYHPIDVMPTNKAVEAIKILEESFPENKIIGIPDLISVEACSVRELQTLKVVISGIIDRIVSDKINERDKDVF